MKLQQLGLVPQILIGVALGTATGLWAPGLAENLGLLGQLFVGMLKAVAPLLVLVLVMSAIANRHESGSDGRKTTATILLYLVGTVCAALLALLMSQLFPQTIALTAAAQGSPPAQVSAVLTDVLFKLVTPGCREDHYPPCRRAYKHLPACVAIAGWVSWRFAAVGPQWR